MSLPLLRGAPWPRYRNVQAIVNDIEGPMYFEVVFSGPRHRVNGREFEQEGHGPLSPSVPTHITPGKKEEQ